MWKLYIIMVLILSQRRKRRRWITRFYVANKLYPVCSARDTTLSSPMCACGGGDDDDDDDDYTDPADGVNLNERICVCVALLFGGHLHDIIAQTRKRSQRF